MPTAHTIPFRGLNRNDFAILRFLMDPDLAERFGQATQAKNSTAQKTYKIRNSESPQGEDRQPDYTPQRRPHDGSSVPQGYGPPAPLLQ